MRLLTRCPRQARQLCDSQSILGVTGQGVDHRH